MMKVKHERDNKWWEEILNFKRTPRRFSAGVVKISSNFNKSKGKVRGMHFGCGLYWKDEMTLEWQIQIQRGLGTCQMIDKWRYMDMVRNKILIAGMYDF